MQMASHSQCTIPLHFNTNVACIQKLAALMQAAVNFMDSVAKIGFYGPRNERLWCQTYTEGLHVWEWAKACEEASEGAP